MSSSSSSSSKSASSSNSSRSRTSRSTGDKKKNHSASSSSESKSNDSSSSGSSRSRESRSNKNEKKDKKSKKKSDVTPCSNELTEFVENVTGSDEVNYQTYANKMADCMVKYMTQELDHHKSEEPDNQREKSKLDKIPSFAEKQKAEEDKKEQARAKAKAKKDESDKKKKSKKDKKKESEKPKRVPAKRLVTIGAKIKESLTLMFITMLGEVRDSKVKDFEDMKDVLKSLKGCGYGVARAVFTASRTVKYNVEDLLELNDTLKTKCKDYKLPGNVRSAVCEAFMKYIAVFSRNYMDMRWNGNFSLNENVFEGLVRQLDFNNYTNPKFYTLLREFINRDDERKAKLRAENKKKKEAEKSSKKSSDDASDSSDSGKKKSKKDKKKGKKK